MNSQCLQKVFLQQKCLKRIYMLLKGSSDAHFPQFATQAHWKYVSLHTFLQHCNYVPCSMFRGSFKVKCPESGAKTHV